MSHITCKDCGSNDHYIGYGLALGGIGSYTLCLGCEAILEWSPDLQYNNEQKEQDND